MLYAFFIGLVAQSSLLLSGMAVYKLTIPPKVTGILAGLGAGLLLNAIAFDLMPDASSLSDAGIAGWALAGAAVFIVGDRLVERKFGTEGVGAAMGIVVGSVVDGVPESMILGTQLSAGLSISVAFVAAILISNIPQAVAPSVELRNAGWSIWRTSKLWGLVVVASALASVLGYFLGTTVGTDGAPMAMLATGGLLAMMTNSLMPFAFEKGGEWAGVATVVGFVGALALPS